MCSMYARRGVPVALRHEIWANILHADVAESLSHFDMVSVLLYGIVPFSIRRFIYFS